MNVAPPPQTTNVLAILALPIALLFPLAGVPIAYVARHQLVVTGERGRGLTTAALVLGYVVGGLWLLFWAMIMVSVLLEDIS